MLCGGRRVVGGGNRGFDHLAPADTPTPVGSSKRMTALGLDPSETSFLT